MVNITIDHIINSLDPTKVDPWTDEAKSVWVPIIAYWIYSISFHFMMKAEIPFFEKYRIHTSEDMAKRNRVTFPRVLAMVASQQVIQCILGLIVITPPDDPAAVLRKQDALLTHLAGHIHTILTLGLPATKNTATLAASMAFGLYNYVWPCVQFFVAMVIMDAHQYFLHRLFHINKFLYKHIHSHHHRLYVPYSFGALYNHPVEGFLLDTLGATIAFELTGMSPKLGMLFFSFSNMKTVDDHCGYSFPWDPLQYFFGNNVVYHDIHHQPYGIKKNFSQPYFTFWDWLLDTQYTGPVKSSKIASKQQ
ncbi:fatty acid hydroxylase superfamily-domain-containing protein [Phascolomyces articulosus]|uniref:Fatty acid hydroxylase superfamily-domain-containing protein n=1 Tax=Phascolomyces articulosus TaxID=60185 RepID=A0AAD5KBP8_9FUNG|nr:fatty acid hydroxylase superfamily-domain-containing protein [Phascolomyces articulosus]